MRRRVALATLYGSAAAVYVVDRLTKLLAERYLRPRGSVALIPHVLHLTYTENPGGAFGVLGRWPWLFFAASVAICAAIVAASAHVRTLSSGMALGMVLGGALGNLTDRIVRGPGVAGKVVDFVDLRIWPVFNVADSAIVLGALVLVLAGIRRRT